MKVLLVHNTYQSAGGEDVVFEAERRLLSRHGHDVTVYKENNADIHIDSMFRSLKLAARTIWSQSSYDKLIELITIRKPDVAHFHNTFPLISPAAFYACNMTGVAVVQTLHNYRLFCPKASFYRAGNVCEECVNRTLFRSVRHSCYRDSRAATVAIISMLLLHRCLGTWSRRVDRYVALTNFALERFSQLGLPESKISLKPNFLEWEGDRGEHSGHYALFVGRLTEEKGILTLLKAWAKISESVLWIAGDGPMRQKIEQCVRHCDFGRVKYLGQVHHDEIPELMRHARFLIFPSEWYEGFPMTIAEAYARGTPVIASRLGAMQELVHDGRTGLHFTSGDADDLAKKVEWAWSHPEQMRDMGRNARAEYEAKYTAERNYEMLMDVYRQAIAARRTSFTSNQHPALHVAH